MKAITRPVWITSVAAAAVLSACGAAGSGPATGASPSASSVLLVQTATATVGGKSETILTNSNGMTLYYFTSDSASTVACTASCAALWPPLLAPSGTASGAASLTGTLSVLDGANGKQAVYASHPLYTYSNDSAPGDTKGQGLFGKWYVATPTLGGPAASASYSY